MIITRAIFPSLFLLLITYAAILPWGIFADERQLLPLIPAMALLAMNARRAHAVPEWMAFLTGLMVDVATQSPLGFWPLLYLTADILAALVLRFGAGSVFARGTLNVFAIAVLAVLQWVLSATYAMQQITLQPVAQTALLAACIYPIVDLMISVIVRPAINPANGNLVRGG